MLICFSPPMAAGRGQILSHQSAMRYRKGSSFPVGPCTISMHASAHKTKATAKPNHFHQRRFMYFPRRTPDARKLCFRAWWLLLLASAFGDGVQLPFGHHIERAVGGDRRGADHALHVVSGEHLLLLAVRQHRNRLAVVA